MTISVKDALKLGRFTEGIVIAGSEGLERIVSYIDILEVPDIGKWLAEGVLLFTTGYAIQGEIEIQIKLISLLHSSKAAGLVIKANRFLKEVPQEMIELANELSIPIISIPGDIPYMDITHPILEEILSSQIRMSLIKNRIQEIINKSELFPERVILDQINKIKEGLDMSLPYVICLIPFKSEVQLNKHINLKQIQQSNKIISFRNDGVFVCIASIDNKDWKDKIHNVILNKSLLDNRELYCLTSRIINSYQELNHEFTILQKDLNYLGTINALKQKMIYYEDVINYILIKKIANNKENVNLVKKALLPIINLKSEERSVMLDTLYYYVNSGGNKTKAAKESYVHRNTFYYRMDKLKRLLNSDLESQEEIYKYKLIIDIYLTIEDNNN